MVFSKEINKLSGRQGETNILPKKGWKWSWQYVKTISSLFCQYYYCSIFSDIFGCLVQTNNSALQLLVNPQIFSELLWEFREHFRSKGLGNIAELGDGPDILQSPQLTWNLRQLYNVESSRARLENCHKFRTPYPQKMCLTRDGHVSCVCHHAIKLQVKFYPILTSHTCQ